MPYKDLIQAFSRTNRIFDKDKRYGQIVTYQYPEKYKDSINAALMLYTEGGNDTVLAPTWHESVVKFQNAERRSSNTRAIRVCQSLKHQLSDKNNS